MPTTGFLANEVAPRLFALIALVVAGFVLLLSQRGRLASWLSTRFRRFVWEGLPPVLFNVAAGIFLAMLDYKALLDGTVADAQGRLLWALTFVIAGQLLSQALAVLHADWVDKVVVQELRDEIGVVRRMHEDAREQRDLQIAVNKAFLKVVSLKRERLKQAPQGIRRVLDPATQSQALVAACWEILAPLVNQGAQDGKRYSLRVAYFRACGDCLEVAHAWNGTAGDCAALGEQAKAHLQLGEERPRSLAVAAALFGVTQWVADTWSHTNAHFAWFHQNERPKLRSIVAAPVKLQGNDSPPHDVIVMDTDRPGFFSEPEFNSPLETLVENLAHRLLLEKYMANHVLGDAHGRR